MAIKMGVRGVFCYQLYYETTLVLLCGHHLSPFFFDENHFTGFRIAFRFCGHLPYKLFQLFWCCWNWPVTMPITPGFINLEIGSTRPIGIFSKRILINPDTFFDSFMKLDRK